VPVVPGVGAVGGAVGAAWGDDVSEQSTVIKPPSDEATGVRYLVFQQVPGDQGDPVVWEPVNEATARTAELAVKAVVGRLPEKEQTGTFAATPARSWTAFTIRVEPQPPKLVLGEAKS
jgi:hypothetical protein